MILKAAPLLHVVPQVEESRNARQRITHKPIQQGCQTVDKKNGDLKKEELISELTKRITKEVLERLRG
jgi:hypothetical protein